MDRIFLRLRYVFLAIFAIGCVGSFAFHYFWKWPEQRCLEKGDWWDWRERVCAHPVLISDWTGRPLPKRDEAAVKATTARPAQN